MGIIEDTNLPADGFSNIAMSFYLSFLVCEPLQAYFIQKFPVAKWLGANGSKSASIHRVLDTNEFSHHLGRRYHMQLRCQ